MKDVTICESSTNHVRFIVNRTSAFEPLARCFPDTFVQTLNECQTITGINFRSFEDLCWRNRVSITDAR